MPTLFDPTFVNLSLLRQRAFNLRWASQPEGVIPLTAADPDFPVAEPIREAICQFSREGYFSYGDTHGYAPFREALAAHYASVKKAVFQPEHVLPVDSASYGIYLICKSFLSEGDEAIIFDPVDFLFRYSIESVGAHAVPFPIPPGTSRVDFSELEALITPRTRLICLCNPLNPTGKVFTKAELQQLGGIAVSHDLLILSDEIWSDIVFPPAVFTSMASLDEAIARRTITVTGFSKSYGLAGLRVGAVMTADPDRYDRIFRRSLHESTVHGANLLGQVAATAALTECGGWLSEFLQHLNRMRDITVSELNKVPGFSCLPPEGCYVAFVDIRGTGKTSADLHRLLLDRARVAVVPGLKQWFGDGASGYIRLCFATSESILREALQRIQGVAPA
jgi:aspartate/methionine/tyrosine aminotransferase